MTAMKHLIDTQITTTEGFTFIVVDLVEPPVSAYPDGEYVVRAHGDGSDAAFDDGDDWDYVYIPASEVL